MILGVKVRYWNPIAGDFARPQSVTGEADKGVDAASDGIL